MWQMGSAHKPSQKPGLRIRVDLSRINILTVLSVHSCLMKHKISSVEVQVKVGESRWGRMESMKSAKVKLPWQELRLCYPFWAQQVFQARTDVLQKYTWEFHHPAPESSPQLWLKPNIFFKNLIHYHYSCGLLACERIPLRHSSFLTEPSSPQAFIPM